MVLPPGTNGTVTSGAPRLALHAISRRYGGLQALDGASLNAAAGEVHALVGENGAGKTTLMKIAFGLETPDSGSMTLDGAPLAPRSPRDAMRAGIGMVQQHFALVDAMTVAENVALGGTGTLDLHATATLITRISADTGLPLDPHARVGTLPLSAQQRLEIVKALARNTHTLILDEPTAVLSPDESRDLLTWARRFADDGGTVILIAHKLREILSIADRITVLRRGRTILETRADATTETALAHAMLGLTPLAVRDKDGRRHTSIALRPTNPSITLRGVTATDENGAERLRDATLGVHAGEILGIAAIEGAGQRELLRVMAGRLTPLRGTATLPASIGWVPEDRHRDAVVLDATLLENLALRGAGSRKGLVAWNTLRGQAAAMMRERDVRAPEPNTTMRQLSGGNQQKFVIGRELADDPRALVVENPTRGLDIRATTSVHDALRAARDAGTAVVVYSSDLDEVLALADRIIVVAGGRTYDVPNDRDLVGRAMLDA